MLEIVDNDDVINIEQTTDTFKVRCQIYSRVVGYLRPVDAWNLSKQEEYKVRHLFDDVLTDKEIMGDG